MGLGVVWDCPGRFPTIRPDPAAPPGPRQGLQDAGNTEFRHDPSDGVGSRRFSIVWTGLLEVREAVLWPSHRRRVHHQHRCKASGWPTAVFLLWFPGMMGISVWDTQLLGCGNHCQGAAAHQFPSTAEPGRVADPPRGQGPLPRIMNSLASID